MMKTQHRALPKEKKEDTRSILIIGTLILLFQLIFHLTVGAKSVKRLMPLASDSIKNEINKQLNNPLLLKQLNFPNTVKRFYARNTGNANWLRSEENSSPTIAAMLVLDCVKQYGLQRRAYHPEILSYTLMHDVLSAQTLCTAAQKVEFELMLTDAMLSMINHLHYGAYNPSLNSKMIDNGVPNRLQAEELLRTATNSSNFTNTILAVQPKIDQYKQLQNYMKLIVGQYTCDSYETPEEEVRTIAMNMERLRWAESKSDTYLQVNIPSFQLIYHLPDSSYLFKVVVGKTSTPTPVLASEISYLETAPDWRIPNQIFIKELLPRALKDYAYFENNHMAVYDQQENFVAINAASLAQIKQQPAKFHARQTAGCDNALGKVVFRFINSHNIYLHDTPEQQYFLRSKRALSHGCIRVEHAEQLASLLLKDDDQLSKIPALKTAMAGYIKQKFKLQTPVPILITYLTITVENALLVRHNDIYKLDKTLEKKMFQPTVEFTNSIK